MRACIRPSGFVQAITPTFMGAFQHYFDTVAVLEGEKCNLKYFLGRLKVENTLEGHIKKLVQAEDSHEISSLIFSEKKMEKYL